MKYSSNINIVIKDIQARLKSAGNPGENSKLLRIIATDLQASNIRRIHNDGEAVDGSLIGDYSNESYRKRRSKKGRQISKVDLSFTGKLSKEFGIEAEGNQYVVGFTTPYASTVGRAQEERYGKRIWGVTDEDNVVIKQAVEDYYSKIIKK